jgi:hypothetical protein
MTKGELGVLLQREVKGLSAYLDPVDYNNAADDASRETGWSFDISGDFKEYWIKQRAKRHLFFYLLSESAHKFQVETIHLEHRFKHYKSIIDYMDVQFQDVMEERPDEFAEADAFKMFGTKIDAGFAYDSAGRDITYDEDQLVDFSPKEDD